MLRTRSCCTLIALLAVACAVSPTPSESFVGVREWIGPCETGQLVLGADSSFRLSIVGTRDAGRVELTGEWAVLPDATGYWKTPPDSVVLLVHGSDGPPGIYEQVTRIDALLNGEYATYLGTGGVVDLNWGY